MNILNISVKKEEEEKDKSKKKGKKIEGKLTGAPDVESPKEK